MRIVILLIVFVSFNFTFTSNLVLAKSTHQANIQKQKDLDFTEARFYVPKKGSVATAGYAVVKNKSKMDIELIIQSAELFKEVETHETVETDGRMSMVKVDKFLIKSGETLELKPRSNHIMLFEPSEEIKEGQMIKIHFTQNGKAIAIPFKAILRK